MFKLYAASLSPLDEKGNLNLSKLAQYCQFLLSEGGCDGIAPLGTTGESNSISLEERLQVPKKLYSSKINPDKVILGVGSSSLKDTVLMIHQAQNYGFNKVLVLPPFYYKNISPEGLFDYFAKLVTVIGNNEVRIHLYHFPQLSAVPFPKDVVAKLFQEFKPMICGLKDSSGDFSQTSDFIEVTGGIRKGFDIYPSTERFLLQAQQIGCAGIISGSFNAFANHSQRALNANKEQLQLLDVVSTARQLSERYPLIPAMKLFQSIRSNDNTWGNILPPLTPLPFKCRIRFIEELKQLEIYPQ
ncbi:MAG: dihydrodipicolinate synthase family protein [Rhodobacteraceae bacterium]|nr:dihydrodipicolinate synthase family protein [Paracoccaceae bacterium]